MRALRSEIAVFALVVDAKDDEAAAVYRHHGLSAVVSIPLQLIAPIETFRKFLDYNFDMLTLGSKPHQS